MRPPSAVSFRAGVGFGDSRHSARTASSPHRLGGVPCRAPAGPGGCPSCGHGAVGGRLRGGGAAVRWGPRGAAARGPAPVRARSAGTSMPRRPQVRTVRRRPAAARSPARPGSAGDGHFTHRPHPERPACSPRPDGAGREGRPGRRGTGAGGAAWRGPREGTGPRRRTGAAGDRRGSGSRQPPARGPADPAARSAPACAGRVRRGGEPGRLRRGRPDPGCAPRRHTSPACCGDRRPHPIGGRSEKAQLFLIQAVYRLVVQRLLPL